MPRIRFRLLQSTIFRIAFLYAAFFCVSVIMLLTFVYFATVREMESQIRHRITSQMNQAQASFTVGGVSALKKQLAEFTDEEDEGLSVYLLVDAQNKAIAGNMEAWPEDIDVTEAVWLMFDIDSRTSDEGVHVLARDAVLPGGYRLLIGYSLRGPDRTRHVMLDVVTASVVLAFLITGLGGSLFSSVIKRRLERVNQICSQVISGHLDATVPLTGGDDAFDHLAQNVNAMLARIAGLVRGLKETSDNIAHDLRTPLNRHRIRLEGIINYPGGRASMQEQIKAGIEELDTIVETLNSILRISQAQSGVASGHLVTFDLASTVIDVIEFYAEFAEQKDIIIAETVPETLMITADKPLVTQALANLIDNAIKYTPGSGQIAISLIRQGKSIEFSVADNGPGIPPDHYEKVKERFFRLEASRTSAGTGLGLSLVDAVAKLHRGELIFEDNAPGLRARLILPVVAEGDGVPGTV